MRKKNKYTATITIDLRLLAMRFRDRGKRFIRVHEVAYELGISPKTAGRILVAMTKLGYLVKWSDGVYMVLDMVPGPEESKTRIYWEK